MPDTPLHPETPREIALCRMACDRMIEAHNEPMARWGSSPTCSAHMQKEKNRLFPLLLTLDDGSEWTFDGRWWRWSRYPKVEYRWPFNHDDGGDVCLTASELRRAADVRENPWTEGEG